MLRDETQPAVDQFQAYLQKEYQIVSEEIERLELQSNLPLLSDKAINHDDRKAFDQIIRIANSAPEGSALRKSAIDEIRRFIGQLRGSLIHWTFISSSKNDAQMLTDQLMVNLSDPDFKVRARAAMLLSNRREKGVPDSLLQVSRTDNHLRGAYYALTSFGYITKRFDRPIATSQEEISQTQLIEMFDIDKLDQWWKEHAAEVNERLADMK